MLWTSELDWTSLVRYRGWGCDDGNLKLAWAASCYSQSVGHKFLSPLMAVLQLVQPTSAPFNLNESLSWSKSRLSVQYYNQLKLRLWQGWGRGELEGSITISEVKLMWVRLRLGSRLSRPCQLLLTQGMEMEMESQQHILQSSPSYSESFCSWKEGSSLSFYASSSRNISLVSWFSNKNTVLTLNVESWNVPCICWDKPGHSSLFWVWKSGPFSHIDRTYSYTVTCCSEEREMVMVMEMVTVERD